VRGYLSQIGSIRLAPLNIERVDENPFFSPDVERNDEIAALIEQLRRDGDSIGAEVTVVASGVPVGLGEPVFGRLDADLAAGLMSINAVKAVGIGDGFDVVTQRGTQHRDEMTVEGFLSNHAGGILGGISSGQDIVARLALKPTSSITTPGRSVDRFGNAVDVVTKGRHDPCVGIRAVPIAEAMVALVLMDHLIRDRGQVTEQDRQTS
jgi:chorismate synthase